MNADSPARIGVIGDARVDASGRLRGAARLALLIQAMGARVALATLVSDDEAVRKIRSALQEAGVDATRVETSSKPTLAMGDQIDVPGLFGLDAVLVAVSDFRLHRFLVDLPVHTAPNARLIGTLPHLARLATDEAREVMLAHDLIIANEDELRRLTATQTDAEAVDWIQHAMTGKNLRAAALRSSNGQAAIVTRTDRVAGLSDDFDRFAASVTVTFARRDPWERVFTLAASA